jgi:hypothetical protein
VKIYVDGVARELKVNLDQGNQNFAIKEPLRIGKGLHGSIGDVRIYRTVLPPDTVAVLATPESIGEIAAIDPAKRTPAQREKLRLCYLDRFAPAPVQEAWNALLNARDEREGFYDKLPTVMVMQEMPAPRDTFLLKRGRHSRKARRITGWAWRAGWWIQPIR